MSSALEFHSVNKVFSKRRKQVHALKEVSFSISEGEVFGFVGPNGAGKSTTIKVMLDIISDYDGEVRIYGKDARQADARRGIAYLPEAPALYEQFTPLEIMRMALSVYGVKHKNEEAWCMQWLERFSVAHNAKRRIRHLSKGNVQRVALAHAMVVEPRLLVLDEPLSGLDPVGRKDVIDILQEYKNQGGAIFFTSHVLHDVERIADRFGFINEGELLTTREPQKLITENVDRFVVRYQSDSTICRDCVCLRSNEFECEIVQDKLAEFIDNINLHSGRLINVRPAISLETVFFQILQERGLNG